MSAIDKFLVSEASCKLQKKLAKQYPEMFIYNGISLEEPYEIWIHAAEEIEVPDTFKYNGNQFNVRFFVNGDEL